MTVIESLQGLAGDWVGVNEFRLMPDDPGKPLTASARVAVAVGKGVTVAYGWVHPEDGAQQGFLFLFDGAEQGEVEGVLLDTWHQSPASMRLTGGLEDSGIHIDSAYAEEWNWAIRIGADADGNLVLTMDNSGPQIPAYAAMKATYTRA